MHSTVKLSVFIGLGGCGWPISLRICCILIALHALMYNAPNSALNAYDMTGLIILAMFRIAPMFEGRDILGEIVLSADSVFYVAFV